MLPSRAVALVSPDATAVTLPWLSTVATAVFPVTQTARDRTALLAPWPSDIRPVRVRRTVSPVVILIICGLILRDRGCSDAGSIFRVAASLLRSFAHSVSRAAAVPIVYTR